MRKAVRKTGRKTSKTIGGHTRPKKSEDRFNPARFYAIFALMIIGFSLVLARLVFVQGIEHELWAARAEQSQEKNIKVEGERGTIYDRNGKVLAMNIERPSVYAVPSAIQSPRKLARRLAPILQVSQKSLHKKLAKKNNFVWLRRKVSLETRARIEKENFAGIGFIRESKRIYPQASRFGHLIGFAGLDNRGLEGVERRHDASLRGKAGFVVLERDAHGQSVFPKNFNYARSTPGKSLTLTVDEVIQHISERELDRIVKETGALGGTVIVMDPWSGEILSMAVRPEFDPNKVGSSRPDQWRNRAITDFYEPGSTFKIMTAAAAIEENLVAPDDLIDCEQGRYRVKGTTIHDHDAIGIVSFREVIAKSSNIGTIKVAEILGPDRLSKYVQDFGFGKQLGIDLGGESRGLLRERKLWSGRSLASIAIGQEIGVTPLQMVTAASVIANGGWLMTPKIVKETGEGATAEGNGSRIKRRVLSETTTEIMMEILTEVVSERGTARRAAIPGYTAAGKTGTAQKFDQALGRYSNERSVSSFVGFAPAEDPVVTILVVVDEPQGIAWGGEIAAPVFSNIAGEVLHYLKVPPSGNRPQEDLTPQNNKQGLLQVANRNAGATARIVPAIGPSW